MVHLLFTQKQAALVLYVLTLVRIRLTGKSVWSTQKQAALMLCSGVS